MNLHHRSAVLARIARPQPASDSLGSVQEGYAAPHQSVYARLAPQNGSLSLRANGLISKESLLLILPPCADIAPGDGVSLQEESTPAFRCVRVQSYPMHAEALLERRVL